MKILFFYGIGGEYEIAVVTMLGCIKKIIRKIFIVAIKYLVKIKKQKPFCVIQL